MAKRMTVIFDDEELYTDLKVEAARRHLPAKQIVADAVREWLERLEDEEDLRVHAERMASYRKEGGVPHEEVMRKLGLRRSKRTA